MKIFRLFGDFFRKIYKTIKKKEFWVFFYLLLRFSRSKRYRPIFNKRIYNLKLNLPDAPSFVYQFKEIFFDEIYKFKALNDRPLIIDCGANVGTSIIYFKKIYPNSKVIGYEADKFIFKFLKENLEMNKIDGVDIFNKAVWKNSDGVCFSPDGADGGSIKNEGQKIESVRLREVLLNSGEVDMLKIDIEGAELEVLEDCQDSLGAVKNLFVEYHSFNDKDQKLSDILSILERNYFRYFIETVTRNKSPFLKNLRNMPMDMQLNIYCWKNQDNG